MRFRRLRQINIILKGIYMEIKVKQLLCMLLLNSILLTAVFSAPATFADDGLSSESIEYTVASAEEPSVSARLVTNKSGTWIKAADGRYWYKHTDGTYTKNDWEYRANQESNPIA